MKVHSLRYWLPVLLWMGLIFWMSTDTFSADHTSLFIEPLLRFLFSTLPARDFDLLHGSIRKAGHVTEYFVLGLLFFRALRGNSPQGWRLRWALATILAVTLFAMSDEFHQSFVASRTSSLADVGFDSAGGLLSLIVILLKEKVCGHPDSQSL